jgi:hypothetical protein
MHDRIISARRATCSLKYLNVPANRSIVASAATAANCRAPEWRQRAALSFHQAALHIMEAAGREVALEILPGKVPITHRRFDAAALRSAFPDFKPTSFPVGIRQTMAEILECGTPGSGQ